MTDNESSVIEHLIEVETQASSVTQAALDEASKKINSAKAKAEQEYLSKFTAKASDLEKQYSLDAASISEQQNVQIEQYKSAISGASQDKAAFNKLLDSILAK